MPSPIENHATSRTGERIKLDGGLQHLEPGEAGEHVWWRHRAGGDRGGSPGASAFVMRTGMGIGPSRPPAQQKYSNTSLVFKAQTPGNVISDSLLS